MKSVDLAEILGFDELQQTPVEIIARGLPYDAVQRLAKTLDLSMEKMCQIIPVSRRTLARYRGGDLDPHLSDHLLMVGKVYERAVDVLESPEFARQWLKAPNYAFRSHAPLEYLSSFAGTQEVLDELGRIKHGVFV